MCLYMLNMVQSQGKHSINASFIFLNRKQKAAVNRSPGKFPSLRQEGSDATFVLCPFIRGSPGPFVSP